jgi:hypothetical protein
VCAIKSFKTNPKDPPVIPAPTIREVYLLTELSHENVINLLHVQVNHAEQALSLVGLALFTRYNMCASRSRNTS